METLDGTMASVSHTEPTIKVPKGIFPSVKISISYMNKNTLILMAAAVLTGQYDCGPVSS